MNPWLIVTGSRNWFDHDLIDRALRWAYLQGARFMRSGACPTGADAICENIWAQRVGAEHIQRYPAQWTTYGKSAGFRRNSEMVTAGGGLCVAFILNGSRGATHTADLAEASGIRTERVTMTVPAWILEVA